MTEDLRPGVAELLRDKHRPHPAARAAAPDPADTDQLIQIATGALLPEYRTKAMGALASHGEAADVFRQALGDRSASDTVRAAGATLLSRHDSDGTEGALIAALADESSDAVRHKIVGGLARVGGLPAYRALGELSAQQGALGEHARFARTLIGYRAGEPADPIVISPADLAPGTEPGDAVWTPDSGTLADDVARDVAPDSYGVSIESAIYSSVECDGQRWVIALSVPDDADRPTIAGLVILQSPLDDSFSTNSVILRHPQEPGRAGITIHRLDGRPEYAGEARGEADTVDFRVDAVRGPGASEKTIKGRLESGRFTTLTVASGARMPGRRPVPLR